MKCFRRLLHICAWTGHRTNDSVRLHAGCYAVHTPCRLLRSAQDNDSVRLHAGCYALHRTTIPSDSMQVATLCTGQRFRPTPRRLLRSTQDNESVRLHNLCFALQRTNDSIRLYAGCYARGSEGRGCGGRQRNAKRWINVD